MRLVAGGPDGKASLFALAEQQAVVVRVRQCKTLVVPEPVQRKRQGLCSEISRFGLIVAVDRAEVVFDLLRIDAIVVPVVPD